MSTRKKGRAAEAAPAEKPVPRKAEAKPSRKRQHLLVIAGLSILTLLTYANSFQAGLIYDNNSRIVEDSRVHAATASNVDLIFHSDYWSPAMGTGLYRPLTTLSLLFNYAVLGNETLPAGYHLVNWILHAITASLLYLLAWVLLGEVFPSAAIAAIWAVHPVLTESVTNIVGRADILGGAAVLGGLLCYIHAVRGPASERWLWLGGAAFTAAVGAFSKESALVLLPAAGLYELVFGASKDRNRRIAGYIALALPFAVYWLLRVQVFAQNAPLHIPFTDNPIAFAGFFQAKLTAIKVAGKEMALMAWPAALSSDYSYNAIPLATWGDWKAWLALAACLAAGTAGVLSFRRNPPVAFAIGFFFLSLAPTSNLALMIGTDMAERLLYLPAMAFVACAVAAGAWLLRRTPATWRIAAVAVVIVALASRTYARNFDWKDEGTLWRSAVAVNPKSFRPHLFLSKAGQGDPVDEAEKSVAILNGLPDEINNVEPFMTAGVRYRERGDSLRGTAAVPSGESIEWYRKAAGILVHGARIQNAHNNRILRMREEQHSSRINPVWSPVYDELGKAYMRLSDFEKAAEAMRAGLALKPSARGFEQLSVAYYQMGDRTQAAISLFEGIATAPNDPKLHRELVGLYKEIDPNGCVVEQISGGGTLNMRCAIVHEHACTAWHNVVARDNEQGHPELAAKASVYAINTLGCSPEGLGR